MLVLVAVVSKETNRAYSLSLLVTVHSLLSVRTCCRDPTCQYTCVRLQMLFSMMPPVRSVASTTALTMLCFCLFSALVNTLIFLNFV